jgi:uridylate kinase
MNVTVISLGGSLIAPSPSRGAKGTATGSKRTSPAAHRGAALQRVDSAFLADFRTLMVEHLGRDEKNKVILVCGGGSLAREYQQAFREVVGSALDEDQDWIGIASTRLNGELVRRIFRQWCVEDLVTDPTSVSVFAGRVMVAAGWKPGFSTDYDAVVLALRFSADMVVNLSNIAMVYTDDPKKNPAAKPLERASWNELIGIIGEKWEPGKNVPFDPVAARAAAQARIRVIVVDGRDLANLRAILEGKSYVGTTIGPD